MDKFDYLYIILYYSYLLPLVLVAVLLITRFYNRELNLIVFLCLSSASSEFIGEAIYSHGLKNSFLLHIGQAIDLMILIGIFSQNVIKPTAKLAAFFVLDAVILFCLIYGFKISLQNQPVYASLLVGITIICLVIYYYYEIFRYEHIDDLAGNPVFWIKSTYLLYFAGTFAYNAFYTSLMFGSMRENVSLVNWILIMICNLVFTLAIWLGRVQKT